MSGMARAYVDGMIREPEYIRQKKLYEMELESLIVPDYNAAEEAGKLIMNLPSLWASATLSERRKFLTTMLDAIIFLQCVDYRDHRQPRTTEVGAR